MAEGKDSFILYRKYKDIFERLSDENAGKLIKHIYKYIDDQLAEDVEDPDDDVLYFAWIHIKHNLKTDLIRWRESVSEKSDSGKVGNLKRWHPKIYAAFKAEKITLDEAMKKAYGSQTSQTSQSDKSESRRIAEIAEYEYEYEYDNDNEYDSESKNAREGNVLNIRQAFIKNTFKENEILNYPKKDVDDFIEYWTAIDQDSKKFQYQCQTSFNIKSRLKGWMKRAETDKTINYDIK